MRNGQSVVVRINDRGPFKGDRIIDISKAAAQRIGMTSTGIAPVKLEVLGMPN
jgi:rare lipoprotein A